MQQTDGVTRFRAQHVGARLTGGATAAAYDVLTGWRQVLFFQGLIGQDQHRYGGAGYGNISARLPPWTGRAGARQFLITGTQTGGLGKLDLRHFARVNAYLIAENTVDSVGETWPSSESMTHGACYDLSPAIKVVFHVHSPVLWRAARRLKIPVTDAKVEYGTPEMALEVRQAYRTTSLPENKILSMGGHEDGIITFGASADEAGLVLFDWLARAYR